MKILQINVTANWGSTGRIVEGIANEVIACGGDSYIMYGRYASESNSKVYRIGTNVNVYMHLLQTRIFDRHGLSSKRPTLKLIDFIKEISPDIIHLHNIHGYYVNYSLLFQFLKEIDTPVVWTLHDCWAFTGHCSHYSYNSCYRWQILCRDCPQKREYPSSFLIDRSRRNFIDKQKAFTSKENLTLVTVSEWLSKEVKKSFLKKYPIRIIHNGIDTNVFTPVEVKKKDLGIEDKFMLLGVASVWSLHKGLDDFIRLREVLSDEYIIVLIGLNDRQIRNLPKGIIGIKRTNSVHELSIYYSVADVYINTSVEETFGLTTVEAMACGTPSIVYDSTACPEVVSADTGFVINKGDLSSLCSILELIRKKGKHTYSNACRNRVTSFYNKSDLYRKYIDLYKELLPSKF
ncbi:glycosyltransferase [Bacteroides helcogenes]|uniref:Glycosyl transferase group 1 n=1 Tax=Bacteroides helcogenes (strain ATCC 35417 / DSM 20613 / JCM 6297 / CCUG 15421 / P 36-108) TaxID=693979 RepID=E6SSX9_BACT6|nr:glycosyltransferase [Bacteroides helcogenes]ADV44210.1 glycosyl transferase group 1 [Bacteroides helcogenes P 36-108]MDY5238376.1 glycosyltransferase [Bacteroides helcogenes]